MREEVLHWAWKKGILIDKEKLSSSTIQVFNPGIYNDRYSGPDFLFASLKFDNLIWYGHVEIHIRASDWYKHKHHLDSRYNNVILHIVSIDDVEVFIHEKPLATLIVGKQTLQHLYPINTKPNLNKLFCKHENQMMPVPHSKTFIINMWEKRMQAKQKQIANKSFLEIMALGFGGYRNSGFLLDNEEMNFKNGIQLKHSSFDLKEDKKGRQRNLQKLTKAYQNFILEMNGSSMNPNIVFPLKNALQIQGFYDTVLVVLDLIKCTSFEKNYIILNAVIPLLWSFSNNQDMKNIVLQIAESLPSENNHIISKYKKAGIESLNAMYSQAYLEIYNQFCLNHKCLTCVFGKNYLKS